MKKKLPHFKKSEEAAKFWDIHSLKDYVHDLKPLDDMVVLSPNLAKKIREQARKRFAPLWPQ